MMSLQEVFAKAEPEQLASLVHDPATSIYYLVLQREDNTFNYELIKRLHELLDQLEKTSGAACLVTIGVGPRFFSTGFDLNLWATGNEHMQRSVLLMQELMSRFLTLGVPTMCVFNGTTIAGGLLLGLCHDFRIMKEDKTYLCMSEINFGGSLPHGLASLFKHTLTPKAIRHFIFGARINAVQSAKLDVVDNLFKD